MEYSLYLFSKLFEIEFTLDCEYDIMFDIISRIYNKYENSDYNNPKEPEYECMVNYLKDNRDLILANISEMLGKSYPFVMVKFGDVVFKFSPTESDEWQSDGEYDYHYCLEYNELCVYRVVNGAVDVSKAVHCQKIFS